ncbi:MAG TPA: methyl-accepting chemotaxis protein, partial [Terriglobales bacterium]|nr:methyl-accepting chemotaxis protein [Terriglobales bacterium]
MTIGKRLYYGFGALLVLLGLLFVVSITGWFHQRGTLKEVRAIEAVRTVMVQNRLVLGNYLLSGDAREVDKLAKGVTDLNGALDDAIAKATTEQVRSDLVRVKDLEAKWKTEFADPLIDKRKQVDAGNATVAELQISYLQLDPAGWLQKSQAPVEDALEVSQKEDDTASAVTLWASFIFFALALGAGFVISRKTSRAITDPLGHLIAVAREIGDSGDLDQKVDIDRQDEIGELAKTFNNMVGYLREMAAVSEAIAGGDLTVSVEPRSKRDTLAHAFSRMTEGLRALVKSVRDSAAQVASGSNQVADASDESAKISVTASSAIDEVTSTMHEMSINVQNMVKNTQTQASSVSETSASIDEMVASIQRVADTAKVLLDISQRSREEVHSGIATMEKATDGLGRINTAIHQSAEIIAVLGQRADDIGKIIEVIDDLAEQTNLLALNAAIEAARAGEHGLGFAVVADEVRKLAEKSTQSTKEIADLIESIQREARQAVENMEHSTRIVEEGLSLGNDLGSALHKISDVVTEVYKFSQEIGAATN